MSGEGRKIRREIIRCCFITAIILFLDQLSKFYVIRFFREGESVPVIRNIFHLTLLHNTGAAFSIFKNHPEIFVFISAFSITFIIGLLLYRAGRMKSFEMTALCFVLGGAAGNLIDRVRVGHVIDFLDFRVWPVFNVADCFITVGAAVLLFAIVRR